MTLESLVRETTDIAENFLQEVYTRVHEQSYSALNANVFSLSNISVEYLHMRYYQHLQ